MEFDPQMVIAKIGEKRLIREFIRPLFGPSNGVRTIGDDCALVEVPFGEDVVVSTDRVPADLVAFKHGIIGFSGLGRYLAALNLSDIAASGGRPIGLLLNLGLSSAMRFGDLKDLCIGFLALANEHGARVLGGDITSSMELSISATSVGIVPKGKGLRRDGARPGDLLFVSKPMGVTPAAFRYLLSSKQDDELVQYQAGLFANFTDPVPLLALGRVLSGSGECTSCMDNTDGYSESFYELCEESGVRLVLEASKVALSAPVVAVAKQSMCAPIELALRAGADFGLVGTVVPGAALLDTFRKACPDFQIVGHIEEGQGVTLEANGSQTTVSRQGWNYFVENKP